MFHFKIIFSEIFVSQKKIARFLSGIAERKQILLFLFSRDNLIAIVQSSANSLVKLFIGHYLFL